MTDFNKPNEETVCACGKHHWTNNPELLAMFCKDVQKEDYWKEPTPFTPEEEETLNRIADKL